MLATELVLLTGGSPTKTFALCEDLSIGPETARPLSYAMQKLNDTVALTEEEANTFLLAMESPSNELQKTMSLKFNVLKKYFGSAVAGDESLAVEPVVEGVPDVSDDEGEIDLFGDDDTEYLMSSPENAKRLTDSAHQLGTTTDSDPLPWDDAEDDGDLSFMDTPSVDAEPVSYDRTALESDDSTPEAVIDTSPEVEDEDDLGDIFG